MTPEQLKMILETIQSVGGDVRDFGLVYIGLTVGADLLGKVFLLVFGLACVRAVRYGVNCAGTAHLRRIAAAAGHTVQGDWAHQDTTKIISILTLLKSGKDPEKEHERGRL